jgi:hypothetical protein
MIMKRLSTEDFIEKAKKVHGDRYDYTNVNYLGSNSMIEIICPIHGAYIQRARKHLEGSGCHKCGTSAKCKSYRTKE